MKKFGFAVVAAIAVLLTTLGISSVAQAYPDAQFDLAVDKNVVYGGGEFTATASANVSCAWDLDWNGLVREGSGTQFATTYTAPAVTEISKIPVTGNCEYADPDASARSAAGGSTWQKRITITVLPSASAAAATPDAGANLPDTGGPNWIFLASGLVLLLAGATAVAVARMRADAELGAETA